MHYCIALYNTNLCFYGKDMKNTLQLISWCILSSNYFAWMFQDTLKFPSVDSDLGKCDDPSVGSSKCGDVFKDMFCCFNLKQRPLIWAVVSSNV